MEGPLYMCISTAPARHACLCLPRGATDDVLEGSGKGAGRQGAREGREGKKGRKKFSSGKPHCSKATPVSWARVAGETRPSRSLGDVISGPPVPCAGLEEALLAPAKDEAERGRHRRRENLSDGLVAVLSSRGRGHGPLELEPEMRYCRLAANAEMRLM